MGSHVRQLLGQIVMFTKRKMVPIQPFYILKSVQFRHNEPLILFGRPRWLCLGVGYRTCETGFHRYHENKRNKQEIKSLNIYAKGKSQTTRTRFIKSYCGDLYKVRGLIQTHPPWITTHPFG